MRKFFGIIFIVSGITAMFFSFGKVIIEPVKFIVKGVADTALTGIKLFIIFQSLWFVAVTVLLIIFGIMLLRKNTGKTKIVIMSAVLLIMVIAGAACIVSYGPTRLMVAVSSSNPIGEIELLIREGADVNTSRLGYTALLYAVMRQNDPAVIKLLLEQGANPNHKFHGIPVLEFAVNSYVGKPNVETVKALIKYGADVNAEDILITAVGNSDTDIEIADALIAAGADVNVKNKIGMTPLMAAVVAGRHDFAGMMLANGANINEQTENGLTPLYIASENDPDMIRLLLENGADVNVKTEKGNTPLMFAAKYNADPAAIELITAYGADINARDNKGNGVFDYLAENKKMSQEDKREAEKIIKAAEK